MTVNSDMKELERAFWAEQAAQISHALTSLSVTTERLATGIKDHVLFAGSVVLVDNGAGIGVWTGAWGATCQGVEVVNRVGNGTVTVTSSTVQANPPAFGQGVFQIPVSCWRRVNIGSRYLTVYGTIGNVVGVQALTTGIDPGAGVMV